LVNKGGCVECGGDLENEFIVTIYDKCHNKTCPNCGKVRKLGTISSLDLGEGVTIKCLKCGKMRRYFKSRVEKNDEGVCHECFLEREGKNGCICFNEKPFLLCPICDEVHTQPALCKKCQEKKTVAYQRKQTFLKVVLPTAIISVLVGVIIGWFICYFWIRKKEN